MALTLGWVGADVSAFGTELSAASLDSGGGRVTNGTVTIDTCVGGVVGWCTNATGGQVAKVGYAGQLYDLVALQVSATPTTVQETATRQLVALGQFDDDTVGDLSDVASWRVVTGALISVGADGLATAATVYQNTTGTAEAKHDGKPDTLVLLVLNTDPDNFGSYAGDGIHDDWQVGYFGVHSTNALPTADPDRDGGNNEYEWITGTHPSNSASLFQIVKIEPVSGVSTQMDISFDPTFTSRTYQVVSVNALTSGAWTALGAFSESTNGTERTVRDLTATNTPVFYRVRVTYEP
jgi:hypothetical protein